MTVFKNNAELVYSPGTLQLQKAFIIWCYEFLKPQYEAQKEDVAIATHDMVNWLSAQDAPEVAKIVVATGSEHIVRAMMNALRPNVLSRAEVLHLFSVKEQEAANG